MCADTQVGQKVVSHAVDRNWQVVMQSSYLKQVVVVSEPVVPLIVVAVVEDEAVPVVRVELTVVPVEPVVVVCVAVSVSVCVVLVTVVVVVRVKLVTLVELTDVLLELVFVNVVQ